MCYSTAHDQLLDGYIPGYLADEFMISEIHLPLTTSPETQKVHELITLMFFRILP